MKRVPRNLLPDHDALARWRPQIVSRGLGSGEFKLKSGKNRVLPTGYPPFIPF